MESIYERLVDLQARGIPAMMVSVIRKLGEGPVEVGKKMVVGANGEAYGTVGGGALEYYAREECKKLIVSRTHKVERYLLAEGKIAVDQTTLPMACGGSVELFYEYVGASEYVYLFGAGHVALATAAVLKTMPFHITVIDDRKEVIDVFPHADQKYHMPFVEFIETIGIREDAIVIVCTPSHQYDYHVINKVIEKQIKLKYIGMLCSPAKLKDYLGRTYETFGKDIDLTNFYAPIGLDLGGGSPAEIAISIVSEVLALHHGKQSIHHMRENLDGHLRYW
jgi:xanthine dehydrogenase accessory factor